jgi:hypothetical protein
MLDLGLGSLESLTLKDLVSLLLGMATWIAAVVLIGFDVMVDAVIIWHVVPIVVELGRRAWRWMREALRTPA